MEPNHFDGTLSAPQESEPVSTVYGGVAERGSFRGGLPGGVGGARWHRRLPQRRRHPDSLRPLGRQPIHRRSEERVANTGLTVNATESLVACSTSISAL